MQRFTRRCEATGAGEEINGVEILVRGVIVKSQPIGIDRATWVLVLPPGNVTGLGRRTRQIQHRPQLWDADTLLGFVKGVTVHLPSCVFNGVALTVWPFIFSSHAMNSDSRMNVFAPTPTAGSPAFR